ncbi:MAG: methyltransferase [Daejeonella sp.]|nr:methyltransferase [Daejeonella sp.]
MISKSQISFVKSLHQKKFRREYGLFIAEGLKLVTEFLNSDYIIETIFFTANASPKLLNLSHNIKLHEVSNDDLSKISTLNTPQHVIAIIKIPKHAVLNSSNVKSTFSLALDGIQDPGNLGTIIRTADWFGLKNIICSTDTVDVYNSKVVQATMGSLSRMNIQYTDLNSFLKECYVPVYGAVLNGQSIYKTSFGTEGIIVLGNEGNGISDEVLKNIKHFITIPGFGSAESLNVATSAAIFCSELKRNSEK